MANLGNSGQCSQNIERDFHRAFCPDLPFELKPWYIRVSMVPKKEKLQAGVLEEDALLPCFAPHEVFALIHSLTPSCLHVEHAVLSLTFHSATHISLSVLGAA